MYNILRTEKVNNRSQITNASEHNFRLRVQKNIDKSKSHLNVIFVNTLNVDTKKATDLQEKLTAYYQQLEIKEKKDNVLMMEFIVSASPEFFTNKTPIEIKVWAEEQVNFFKTEFGEQLKIAILHLDEKTPHLHFMIGTEIKSVKKYKNQKGEFFKETWSLNARRYDPQFLVGLHTRHAEWNKKYDLKRGEKKSMNKHTPLKEFYSVVEIAIKKDYQKAIANHIDKIHIPLLERSDEKFKQALKKQFAPVMNKLLKEQQVLKAYVDTNYAQLQNDINARNAQFLKDSQELEEQKSYYGKGIKKILMLEKECTELREKNKLLSAKNDEYEKLTAFAAVKNKNNNGQPNVAS